MARNGVGSNNEKSLWLASPLLTQLLSKGSYTKEIQKYKKITNTNTEIFFDWHSHFWLNYSAKAYSKEIQKYDRRKKYKCRNYPWLASPLLTQLFGKCFYKSLTPLTYLGVKCGNVNINICHRFLHICKICNCLTLTLLIQALWHGSTWKYTSHFPVIEIFKEYSEPCDIAGNTVD